MPEKIIDAVLSEAKRTSDVSQDVLKSGAYLYPLKVGTHENDNIRAGAYTRKRAYSIS